jgi:acetyl-CoA C-acetyltransferase
MPDAVIVDAIRRPIGRATKGSLKSVRADGLPAIPIRPLIERSPGTVAAIRPEIMGLGPILAIQELLELTGMTIDDIDIVEINEAFAAQIVPCREDLGIPEQKPNPFGGVIALGLPFGMTGQRIMTTLLNGLQKLDATYGIESMCVAGGMGQAMLVERLA